MQTVDEVYDVLRSDKQVFGLVAKDRYEELQRRGDLRLVRLADYTYRRRDFVPVSLIFPVMKAAWPAIPTVVVPPAVTVGYRVGLKLTSGRDKYVT